MKGHLGIIMTSQSMLNGWRNYTDVTLLLHLHVTMRLLFDRWLMELTWSLILTMAMPF